MNRFIWLCVLGFSCLSVAIAEDDFKPDILAYAPHEGVRLTELFDPITRFKASQAKPAAFMKIPLLNHTIWLSNPIAPKEIRLQDKKYMEKRIRILNEDPAPWRHVLWTNVARDSLPETYSWAEGLGVVVCNIDHPQYRLQSAPLIADLVKEKKMGIAADFLRFDFLKNEGGFYADANYILRKSPIMAMKTYDFIAHSDRGEILVDVYMIGAKPNHPILVNAFNLTLRNLVNPPSYVQQAQKAYLHPQDYTGVMTYWPFNFSFFKHVNGNTTDWVYPLATKNPYPEDAKQYHEDDFERGTIGQCEDSQKAKSEEHLLELYENYMKNRICVEAILGWDSRDGDSWLPEGVLPQYAD